MVVRIRDKNNPVNPINDSIVGSYPNGGTAITGTTGTPSAPVPVTVSIPDPINSSDYYFYLDVAPTGVFPSPAVSDSTERTVIPNPISRMVLDTSTATYANIFKTDKSEHPSFQCGRVGSRAWRRGLCRQQLSLFPMRPTAQSTSARAIACICGIRTVLPPMSTFGS